MLMNANVPEDGSADENDDRRDATVEAECMAFNPSDTVRISPELLSRYSLEYAKIQAEEKLSDENLCRLHQRNLKMP